MLTAVDLDGVTFVGGAGDEEDEGDGEGDGSEVGGVGGAGDVAIDGAAPGALGRLNGPSALAARTTDTRLYLKFGNEDAKNCNSQKRYSQIPTPRVCLILEFVPFMRTAFLNSSTKARLMTESLENSAQFTLPDRRQQRLPTSPSLLMPSQIRPILQALQSTEVSTRRISVIFQQICFWGSQ